MEVVACEIGDRGAGPELASGRISQGTEGNGWVLLVAGGFGYGSGERERGR